ncbi:MAG: NYN domain-containing protein [Chloroflexi bacterium]|nr:NYN domain-containing protein [Chloroflexota bacterium]
MMTMQRFPVQENSNDVAVFVDFENIYISVRNRYDVDPNFEHVIDKCAEFGRVTISRAYADWYRYPRVTNALYANGIEPMYVPTYYYDRDEGRTGRAIKNSVDIHLTIDLMKTLFSFPNIGTYIVVTGDRDFIPLINTIRQYGKKAVVIGVGGAASNHLAQSADEFIFYRQLMEDRVPQQKEVKDIYKTLVEAIHLARRRKISSTLASLKLLMIEVLGEFDQSKYKDNQGKPFTKFKDFVREAQRRNFVQIFSSGTVNEIFLPGEDPYKLSSFVSNAAPAQPALAEERQERQERHVPVVVDEEVSLSTDEVEELEEFEDNSSVTTDFTSEEWQVFRSCVGQFAQPTLFINIFDSLRSARNAERLNLTNKELKDIIKQAIREGYLMRISRGSHGYYQLNHQAKFPEPS